MAVLFVLKEMSSDEIEKKTKHFDISSISAKVYQVNIEYKGLWLLFVLMGRYFHYQNQ